MREKKLRLSLWVLLLFVVCAAAAVPFISRAALQDPPSSSPTSLTEQKTKLPQSVPYAATAGIRRRLPFRFENMIQKALGDHK